jgi:magnesium-protoporphyrin O-methyltransferase
MTSCCDPKGILRVFNEAEARKDARGYRRSGLDAEGRRVVDFLLTHGARGANVLEVGGGIGAIQIELLRAGAAHATNVELSPAYETIASELATEHGVADRIDRRVADFAVDHAGVGPADAVVLHKVVCCYPDMPGLVRPAAERARRWLVLTFPVDRWWVRAGLRLVNFGMAIFRNPFRAFVHDPRAMVEIAERAGLRTAATHRGPVWQLLALERT